MPKKHSWLPELLRFGKSVEVALTDGFDAAISDDDSVALLLTFTGILSAPGVARLASLAPGRHYGLKNATTGGKGGKDVSVFGPTGTDCVTIPVGKLVIAFVNAQGVLEVVSGTDRISDGVSTIAIPPAATFYSVSPIEGSNRWLRFTGSPAESCIVQLPYFDASWWFLENGTSASLSFHTSGPNISVPSGVTKQVAHRGVLRTVATLS